MANTPTTSFRLSAATLAELDELRDRLNERDRALRSALPPALQQGYTRSEAILLAVHHYLEQVRERDLPQAVRVGTLQGPDPTRIP